MEARTVRKLKVYLLSVDTFTGIAAFAISLFVLGTVDSANVAIDVAKTGGMVSLAMLGLIVTVWFKLAQDDDDEFIDWLNQEFDSAYKDLLGAMRATAMWAGFTLIASLALTMWAIVVSESNEARTVIPESVLSVYIGLLFYTVVAVVQSIVAAIGFFRRKRQYKEKFGS